MVKDAIEHQEHGYRSGHQLLSATLKLPKHDQETIDRLSDISGLVRPGEEFAPYVTGYPLPSRSHYILARTWQDLNAPRAGCVLTHSLLIPMARWEASEQLEAYFDLLTPVSSLPQATANTPVKRLSVMRNVSDHRTVELVEALFLEGRQPIVYFEAPEAEFITLKLLTALWPAMRRNFAVCSFALSPRKVEGREFDLVFAPKSVRARFADWRGRRIEASQSTTPRHKWSSATAVRIFQSASPNLTTIDALGVLRRDANGDESALRLALLWDELAAKAETTPSAVLGMLDILNSQQKHASDVFKTMAPVISHAVEVANGLLPDNELWRFFKTLIGKFPTRLPPRPVLRVVQQSAAALAQRNGRSALEFAAGESKCGKGLSPILLAGIGNGLSASDELPILRAEFDHLPTGIGLGLIAASSKFARKILALAKRDPESWLRFLIGLLETEEVETRRKARRRLISYLDHAVQTPLLQTMLEGISKSELIDTVLHIGRNTKFEVEDFYAPIIATAKCASAIEDIRDFVEEQFTYSAADQFLVETLNLDSVSLSWLDGHISKRSRARRLALKLLERASDRNIQLIAASDQLRLLTLLCEDLDASAPQLARLITVGSIPIVPFLETARQVLDVVDSPSLVEVLLKRALAEAPVSDSALHSIICEFGGVFEATQLINWAIPASATASRLGENVVALDRAPHQIRNELLKRIRPFSERLVNRSHGNLGEAAYRAWSSLIEDAGRIDSVAQLAAASLALNYALQHTQYPTSELVTVSFPLIYEKLAQAKEEVESRFFPAIFFAPWALLADWDRAKPARRDLLDAFLKSKWPPADLMVAAIHAGIEHRILRRLSRIRSGPQYISDMEDDLSRLDPAIRVKVKRAIDEFRNGAAPNDWD